MNIEKRQNTWYAVLTIPPDVRPVLGKLRFCKSTKTSDKVKAQVRAILMVAHWKAEITKIRGTLPNADESFWENMRREYVNAQQRDADSDTDMQSADWGHHSEVVREAIEAEAFKLKDPAEVARVYQVAVGLMTPLGPLVTAWKGSLRTAQKTIDQQHRDMVKMADHFITLEALTPPKIKAWTDQMMKEGVTASSLTRIGNGCRSVWLYLQQSGKRSMVDPDPFVGPFKLAQRTAVRNITGRSGTSYTPEQLVELYMGAIAREDAPLVDLIALGAYTGARIEELCMLTADTVKDGVFHITKSKTKAGIREVPIHPALAPLVGRMLAASKDGYLVPSTSKNQYTKRSHALGMRFGRLKKSLGFGPEHVFHGTRNTLITLMQRAGVEEVIATDVVGHDKKTLTYGLYSSGSSMAQKLEAISKVSYPAPLDAP